MKSRSLLGLFLAVTALILAAGVSAEDTYIFELTEAFSFREETDHWSIDISLPEVSGMADPEEQADLNAYLFFKKDGMLEDYRANKASAAEGVAEGFDPHFSYQYSWDTVTDNEHYFVFRITWFFAAGSATAMNEYFNLDKETGKLLTFEDVVPSPEEAASIRDQIFAQMEEANEESQKEYGANIFFTEDDSLDTAFGQVSERNHWYYNEKGELVITFDKYDIAPGVMGSPEFTVSTEP